MCMPTRHEIAYAFVEGGFVAAAGYVGAWFAAGPRSALSDPRAGAIIALAWRVTFATIGKKLLPTALNLFNQDKARALSAVIILSSIGGVLAGILCGYPVGLDDISVLTIGLFVGVPVALVGMVLTDRLITVLR